MTDMRILQIGPVLPEWGGADTGGIATHLTGLATHLVQRGHTIGVLADNRPYESAAWPAMCDGVSVYGVRDFTGPHRLGALAAPSAWAGIVKAHGELGRIGSARWVATKVAAYRSVINAFRPEVIHVHTLEARCSFATVTHPARTPIVATAHSTHYVEFAGADDVETRSAVVSANLARARDVIFVSEYLRRRYIEVFGDPEASRRDHVLLNPIEVGASGSVDRAASRAALGIPGDERVVLFVGNLIPRKDPATLIRALAALDRRGERVVAYIAGEGPDRQALETLAYAEGLAECARFVGRKSQNELRQLYGMADLLVFPSLMESFGLVALEAMLHGLPVVGSPEVLPEVVPASCGIQVAPGDSDALAEALSTGLSRNWDHGAIRAHALEFDWRTRIPAFEQVYADALTG